MDHGLLKWTASTLPAEVDKQLAGQMTMPLRDLLAMSRDLRPESEADRAKLLATSQDALRSSTISLKKTGLALTNSRKADTVPSAAMARYGSAAYEESNDDEPPSLAFSNAQRRRMSLMNTTTLANVMGSQGVMKKRLSLPSEDTFKSIEPIPRERRGNSIAIAEATLPERPTSSIMSSRKSVELSERDVVLPGFRARALSARTKIKQETKEALWTKAFKIDYAPQSFEDIKRKRSLSEPLAGPNSASSKPGGSDGVVELEIGHAKSCRRPWAEPAPATAPRGGPVEIHYESCLPKRQWLQVRPKKFVSNHKHGTPFENRPLTTPRKIESIQEVTVWENPYHILLFEKAAKPN